MLSIIVARDLNNGIGKNNKLLYNIKEDMIHFKNITMGKKIIMGRKTFESLPNHKPLPNRTNIILTRNAYKFVQTYPIEENMIVTNSSKDWINQYKYSDEEVIIIGGANIYKEFLPHCDKIYLTQIYSSNKEADSFFEFDLSRFEMVSKTLQQDYENELTYHFFEFVRK